jgi:EAL domain-containing protein (putative c-di-GMP-specific phosphodiesterase class I)
VNTSSRLLASPGLAHIVQSVLVETGVPAGQLCLVFRESEVLDHEPSRANLKAVAELGVRIALDDLGTGHVSLTNLCVLPLNQLEIDCRLFGVWGGAVDGAADETAGGAVGGAADMLQLIMSVSRLRGLETVAKMVQRQEQVDWARRAGLTLGQGDHLCPPGAADGLTEWLTDKKLMRTAG